MAEDNVTLTTFSTAWEAYQDCLKATLAQLTAEQIAPRRAHAPSGPDCPRIVAPTTGPAPVACFQYSLPDRTC